MIYEKLTRKEQEVVDYATLAYSNDEIARLMFISEGRVNNIIMDLYKKYEVWEGFKRCRLMRKRLEELGVDFSKVFLDRK